MLTTTVFEKTLKPFNECKSIIISEGGQSSSKTYSILQAFIFLSKFTKNKIFTIVAESVPFLKVGALRQFLEILHTENLYKENDFNRGNFTYQIGTNIIEFKAYDQPSKAVGAKRDYLFINEAINVPYETFINLESRTNVCTWLDFNPSFEFWAHTKLLQSDRDDIAYVHSTYKDNEYLPQKIIDTIERYKDYDPNRYRVMGLGLIGTNEGQVFNNWHIADNFERGDNEKLVFGIDFGFTNDPSTCISVYKQNGELWVDEVLYGIGMTNLDISEALKQENLLKTDIIYADSAEPKSIDELRKRGWNVKPVKKGPNSIIQGIDVIKQYKINVSKRSVNLIRELRQYMWLKDMNGNYMNKPGGTDHCFVGDTKITTDKGDVKIKNINIGDIVLTSEGYKKVLKKFNNGSKQTNEYTLYFNDKVVTLECTDEHKIKTDKGWKKIKDLIIGDMLYLIPLNIYNTEQKNTTLVNTEDYIELSGNTIMEKYLKDMKYTTKMKTHQIMIYQILSVLKNLNINHFILKNFINKIQNGLKHKWRKIKTNVENGIKVMKVKNGIKTTLNNKNGELLTSESNYVNSVMQNMNQKPQDKDFVLQNVSRNITEIIIKKSSNNIVYDLMVDDCHEYYANGILVHNCIDAMRYAISMKYGSVGGNTQIRII